MKKTLIGIIILLLAVSTAGCKTKFFPPRREIDDMQLVQVIGIDKSTSNPDGAMITIVSKKVTEGGGQAEMGGSNGSGQSKGAKALVQTSEGKTVFDAARNIQTHTDKTVFWGHTDYYLIGEEAAKENITKYIDFFTRDHELRIEAKVYIVKGSTAKDLIEEFNMAEFFIVDKLDSLGHNLKQLSTSEEMKIFELMRFIDIHHGSARVPAIELVTRKSGKNMNLPDIESYGYAIIADLKLAGFIGRDISRGVNLITGEVGSSIVVVKDLSGQDISLEITHSSIEAIPYFIGDELEQVTLKAEVKSNLGEVQSQRDVAKKDSISFMEAQQSIILKKEMQKVLEKALEFKSDCLDICDKIRLKRPLKWQKIEGRWMKILQELKFEIQVVSKIQRTYVQTEPTGYKGSEK